MENRSKLLALLAPKVNFEKKMLFGNAIEYFLFPNGTNPILKKDKLEITFKTTRSAVDGSIHSVGKGPGVL